MPPPIDLYTLTGTQDTTATFDEHESLKPILRAGSGQFDIQTVCEVQMRRAPFPVFPIFNSERRVPFLAGGQTISPLLPWYSGKPDAMMETESAAMLKVVSEQLACRLFSLALDCHSGYGFGDSIWFPYAKTRRQMAHLPEMYLPKTMLEQSMPHHDYSFEPQSNQYLLHGDLWGCAYDRAPSVVLHAIRYIKLRIFVHGGVVKPRNSGTIAAFYALP